MMNARLIRGKGNGREIHDAKIIVLHYIYHSTDLDISPKIVQIYFRALRERARSGQGDTMIFPPPAQISLRGRFCFLKQ